MIYLRKINGPVVQLNRISDFGSEGCRFESCRGHFYRLLKMLKCCVIIPYYNEHDRILSEEFIPFLKNHSNFSFMFIDDGSTDNTYSLIEKLSNQHERIYSYRLDKNQGKAEAVRQGYFKSKEINEYDYYAYLDADLAIPLSELLRLEEQLIKSRDIQFCFSSKKPNQKNELNQSFKRILVGRVLAQMVKWSLNLNVYDTQCGCKMMTKNLAEFSFNDKFY